MLHAGKVMTHRTLLRAVWGPEYGEEADYLRVYVRQLRLKIEKEPSQPKYILTEPGVGYVFRPQVIAANADETPSVISTTTSLETQPN
jgi:two-component system, OmpR family, KDP operon response regulator KdpE